MTAPEEVYEQPANPFVFRFLGNYNLFHGRHDDGASRGQGETASGQDAPLTFVRPHDIEIRATMRMDRQLPQGSRISALPARP